ncbi:MAG: extensin family protein [Bauldia sp.]
MLRRVAYLAVIAGVAIALTGCALSLFGYERRAAWRDAEERSCMASRQVQLSAWVRPDRGAANDRGACGIDRPLQVSAFEQGTVELGPAATLGCPITAAVEGWLNDAVQPAAIAWFGEPITDIKQISAYSCRPRNNESGERLSEHAFGNALDVAGFRLADGRMITVKHDWSLGDDATRSFLREVLAAACERFKTVLGPGVKYHGDHFHLDLAHHNEAGTSRYCRPVMDIPPPRRAPYSPGLFARTGGLVDYGQTSSITPAPAPGELLTQAPPDVIGEELGELDAD